MPLSRLGLCNERVVFTNRAHKRPSPKIEESFHVHLGIPEIFEISYLVLMAVVNCNVELSAVSSSIVPPPIG